MKKFDESTNKLINELLKFFVFFMLGWAIGVSLF